MAALETHWLGQFYCLGQGYSNEENKTGVKTKEKEEKGGKVHLKTHTTTRGMGKNYFTSNFYFYGTPMPNFLFLN